MTDPLIEVCDEPIPARFWISGQWTGATVSPLEGLLSPIQHSRWLGKWSKRPRMKTEPRSATAGSRTGKLPKGGVWKGCQVDVRRSEPAGYIKGLGCPLHDSLGLDYWAWRIPTKVWRGTKRSGRNDQDACFWSFGMKFTSFYMMKYGN